MTLGLLVVGDYALATGADRHVAFAAALLGRTSHALEWAWLIPANRVQLAAALHEAWQRPHPVACFGGLGDAVDDHTRVTIAALQHGRDEVGLPRYLVDADATVLQIGNVAFFHGHPSHAHALFAGWWQQSLLAERGADEGALTHEQVRWVIAESSAAIQARRHTRLKHPTVSQRLIAGADSAVALRLTGSSKGKVQAARKALQAALKHV